MGMFESVNDFLAKGYCITCDNDIVSWAFSAATSSKEIDIGIFKYYGNL